MHSRSLICLTMILLLAIAAVPLAAATITVTTLADETDGCLVGACSLREALASAGSGDTVSFGVTGTITLTHGQLSIATDVTVTGPGSGSLSVDANLARGVVAGAVGPGGTIWGIPLRRGSAGGSGDPAGGCLVNRGTLALTASVIELCRTYEGLGSSLPGGDGGALFNAAGATLTLTTSTITGSLTGRGDANASFQGLTGGRGGGLFNAGTAFLDRSRISGNTTGASWGPYGPGGPGGGIYNSGVLRLDASTVSGNQTGDGSGFCAGPCYIGTDGKGGGIYTTGMLTVNDSTISGNSIGTSATGWATTGGGLLAAQASPLVVRLRNATLTANTANGAGGGLAREGTGTVRLANTLLAGNAAGTADVDCTGGAQVVSDGHNLVGVNNGCASVFVASGDQAGTSGSPLSPAIGSLAANGGPTATHLPASNSPAVDHGDPVGCTFFDPALGSDQPLVVDQRGETRPRDGDGNLSTICDVGSVETATVTPVTHQLTVTPSGLGSGQVTSTPAGIDCPGDCQESYLENQDVSLAAAALAGSYFAGWSGDCSGNGACQVQLSADRDVGASFGRLFRLDVAKSGAGTGTVTSQPVGIDCGADCAQDYAEGTAVTLTPTADPTFVFVAWSGDCAGPAPCDLTMAGPRAATARFEPVEIFKDGFESGGASGWSP